MSKDMSEKAAFLRSMADAMDNIGEIEQLGELFFNMIEELEAEFDKDLEKKAEMGEVKKLQQEIGTFVERIESIKKDMQSKDIDSQQIKESHDALCALMLSFDEKIAGMKDEIGKLTNMVTQKKEAKNKGDGKKVESMINNLRDELTKKIESVKKIAKDSGGIRGSGEILVLEGGVQLGMASKINFDGTGVSVTMAGTQANVEIEMGGVGSITQDDVGDGVTYKQYSATEKTKLAGIEPGADVTDATNVAAAGAEMTANKGTAGGYAELDGTGKVPSGQLPSFVDDVIESANFAALPGTGETGKIYITLDDGKTYRWSGSAYVEISASLALGESSGTAYRGDRGKTAYDHSQVESGNPHNVTKSDVGLGNVDNTSDATKNAATATLTNKTITKPTVNGSVQGVTAATDGTTVTLDLSTANMFTVTIAGNRTIALSNASTGQIFSLRVLQDGTGSRTVTWFTTIKRAGGVAPTLTTTANKADMFVFVCTGSGTYDGFIVGQNI